MTKTNHSSVQELADTFEKYWVPFSINEIGQSTSGFIAKSLVDEKSGDLYLERYISTIDSVEVYKFDKFNHPTDWEVEEGCKFDIN